jgi:2-oxoglutarate ferredoxin oxidoreductase subunit beta
MHSTAHKIIAEVIDELGLQDKAVSAYGIGCCAVGRLFMPHDFLRCPHGRALAVASAYKRANPEAFVYSYQGDGDIASIGIAETIYAANRGENLSVIFVNNLTFSMTGGQMAPTTLIGQKATTAPYGRNAEEHGYPIHLCEVLDALKAPRYLARVSATTPKEYRDAKAAIRHAFQNQLEGKGFSMVEFISNCPTNWGMSPVKSLEFMRNETMKEFPLGVIRDRSQEEA